MRMIAAATALAVALAWPAAGEAQSKKAKARSAAAQQQQSMPRHAKVRRTPAAKPCVVRTWIGCHGWDPDPNVRMMLRMDAGRDDL